MQRQQKNWSIMEKQKLNAEAEKFRQNNRINWTLVAEQMHDRTPTQCRLQYRNNNQDRSKVNVIWSTEMSHELMLLTYMYGKKWKFLQTNYFPDFTAEQLRLKAAQQEARTQKYKSLLKKAVSDFVLDVAELKIHEVGSCWSLANHSQV
ncbi:Myb-like_DNA-binding domain-containing protein [Hexamita inflata]|uniref:Myb-like DNA-binding domain-containing protein n=1 Tax=Hexamita inflata TaxID=28002 RepID=A0AA86NG23_9EUKA|nr:Myb-like DNA-binding domain-containing protein [Hexamita inflata]